MCIRDRSSTVKPTACTAGCELVLHNEKFLGATPSVFCAWIRLRSELRMVSPLQHYGASQRSPRLVQGRRPFVVAWEDQREHDHEGGIFGALFGRPGADQASSSSGALHDFGRSSTRFLVPTSTLSERVRAGGSTQLRCISRRSRRLQIFAPPLRPIISRFSGFRGLGSSY